MGLESKIWDPEKPGSRVKKAPDPGSSVKMGPDSGSGSAKPVNSDTNKLCLSGSIQDSRFKMDKRRF
jgi:hypothetical protein